MKKESICSIFMNMPTLETERLLLRPMKRGDADDMYAYASRADVTEYLLWSPHSSPEYSRTFLKFVEKRYRAGQFYD